MTNLQDAESVETIETQDAPVEVVEETAVESDNDASDEVSQDEAQEVELTPEQKLEKLEEALEARQKKINRQTKASSEQLKKIEQLNRRLQELEAQQQAAPEKGEPVDGDYETYEEYDKARIDYFVNQKVTAMQKQMLEQQQKEQLNQIMQQRESKVAQEEAALLKVSPQYTASKNEFQVHLNTLEQTGAITPHVGEAIVTQAHKGNVAEIINYFGADGGANLDELTHIASLTPVEAAIEIYKIQQKLGAKTPVKKETKPLPKPTGKPKAGGGTKKTLDNMSGDEALKALGLK